MVKISCKTVTGHKPGGTEEPPQICIHPQHHPQHVADQRVRRSSLSGLCCLITALILCTCSLIYASVYIYHYYIIQQVDESQFQCSVYYEDGLKAPQREKLQENVKINLQQNYERISVPPPQSHTRTHTHPATIIHDFNTGVTAYHDITLDKCYITELNSSVVLPPRNLWKLLVNVKMRTTNEGVALPQTYIIQEEMVISDRVTNTLPFGMLVHKLCEGKQTYQIRRRLTRRRIAKREEQSCHSIRHFENTFVVETMICSTP
ncbi:integral membrane protein 2C-like [Trichomycterus rosablanca]|uniref:integral membrane protein 2C-like n=1 Tax=Trichomycterus rosablanca TaxID=2290929 RepID=UPI002F35BD4E